MNVYPLQPLSKIWMKNNFQNIITMEHINGFISAPFTPMFNDGSINYALIPEYVDFYVRNGLDGAFTCGTTGEGVSLTLEERAKNN